MELLEVERGPHPTHGALSGLQPGTLADLVADSLTGYTEIPHAFAGYQSVGDEAPLLQELKPQLKGPPLPRMEHLVVRDG